MSPFFILDILGDCIALYETGKATLGKLNFLAQPPLALTQARKHKMPGLAPPPYVICTDTDMYSIRGISILIVILYLIINLNL